MCFAREREEKILGKNGKGIGFEEENGEKKYFWVFKGLGPMQNAKKIIHFCDASASDFIADIYLQFSYFWA